ncbi:hypothetical protein EYC84_012112 [Monilinia fructicola]|uniref:Uncharacterized protein n=1 Tax=Monilinia fructicola TaxID=38448 RepID=A0A5M9J4I3_MONFR|nr:hypothetical protein EYC84_012112 [Monilinia fructicola]
MGNCYVRLPETDTLMQAEQKTKSKVKSVQERAKAGKLERSELKGVWGLAPMKEPWKVKVKRREEKRREREVLEKEERIMNQYNNYIKRF